MTCGANRVFVSQRLRVTAPGADDLGDEVGRGAGSGEIPGRSAR